MRTKTKELLNEIFEHLSKQDLIIAMQLARAHHDHKSRVDTDKWREGQRVMVRVDKALHDAVIETVNQKTCTVKLIGTERKLRVPPSLIYQRKG